MIRVQKNQGSGEYHDADTHGETSNASWLPREGGQYERSRNPNGPTSGDFGGGSFHNSTNPNGPTSGDFGGGEYHEPAGQPGPSHGPYYGPTDEAYHTLNNDGGAYDQGIGSTGLGDTAGYRTMDDAGGKGYTVLGTVGEICESREANEDPAGEHNWSYEHSTSLDRFGEYGANIKDYDDDSDSGY